MDFAEARLFFFVLISSIQLFMNPHLFVLERLSIRSLVGIRDEQT